MKGSWSSKADSLKEIRRKNSRVHLHTTISVSTREMLNEISGESGRINDTLEEAVRYFSKRKDHPDCETCEASVSSKLLSSLVTTAEMGLMNSEFLEAFMNLGHANQSSNEFIENISKVGVQQTKLLRGLGVIENDTWKNTYHAFAEHIKLLEKMGILRSAEFFPERKTILATVKMLRTIPEVIILFLLSSWDEAGYTVDVEIIAANKISIHWLDDKEFSIKKENRNQRIFGAWKERREELLMKSGRAGNATLPAPLLDWLITHTINDPISEKTLISIRNVGPQYIPSPPDKEVSVFDHVQKAALNISSTGLLERCDVKLDGDLVRVQIGARTPSFKDFAIKLILNLVALDGVEEISREDGESTAVLHFGHRLWV
ncbi:MAG: hypothetical protein AM325_014310 [Candidatus Thorarchaeota archaeon SMTZ1-45]|nr:MAG: hypothetical protein AM325_15770 [Candidatus Thorarchaeota archaeon SMTZ1-45]